MRWSIVVGEGTDQALRAHLGRTGGRKGSLSRFVEQAVHDKIFFDTLAEAKEKSGVASDADMEMIIGEAVAWARETRS